MAANCRTEREERLLLLGVGRGASLPKLPTRVEVRHVALDSREEDALRARACLDRLAMIRRRLAALLN